MEEPRMHIAMYPWLAIGHMTPYIQLANKLARRGHRISIFIPPRTHSKLQHLNLHPQLITFVPITLSHVEGLPQGAETTADVDRSRSSLLMVAADRTEKQVEHLLVQLKPNIVFFDMIHWLPDLARRLGIKSVQYWVNGLVVTAYDKSTETQNPPFPDLSIRLHMHEEKLFERIREMEFGNGVRFVDRHEWGARSSDAVAYKNCREMEGPFADYLEKVWGKPVLLSGPVIPEPQTSSLEPEWDHWLGGFKHGSVVYCAFGSECILELSQFQELLLGLELSGMPFLVAVKPPKGCESVEAALPEGFEVRVRGRGIVHGGWVQQQLILEHPSVGCFITHCGAGSMLEALLSQCQLVLLPTALLDQIFNARMISQSFRAGVEVKKGEEDGLFTKESVCEAVRAVMNEENEIAKEVKENHAKLRNILLSTNFDSNYIDNFCHQLQDLLKS
ncbi:cyanidin 3-O-galactoside 2''-O-xylosyltransferase FGGT1-like [Prosopis cineraria]|uniref:cyanidin 3-O-galactoside 2''-O-xylosyltransferase FGGT1-like n=1 Tax=Prosopis cineraria TaxID=364024 RepID=UPI0024108940|nr:cyanidin 3-O-galactoside 2''-O-xylosyltransferase FGGT1-like [Prosopis cineraria]